jgi:hypothetical protein
MLIYEKSSVKIFLLSDKWLPASAFSLLAMEFTPISEMALEMTFQISSWGKFLD